LGGLFQTLFDERVVDENAAKRFAGSDAQQAEMTAAAGITLVFAVFMLLRREDWRNRFICLLGHSRHWCPWLAISPLVSRLERKEHR
jgi:hypothetical protein